MKNYFKLFLAALLLSTVNISYSQNSAVLAGTGAAGSQDLNSVLSLGNNANNNAILNASGLSVGTATVGTSALVDFTSTTSGLLIPRMTTTERDAILTPETGLMVYNTTDNAFNFYNGTAWTAIGGATTLSGLTDVNTATPTAGNFLVGDGVDFESIAMSGDILMTGTGVTSIQANAVQVADVDFINTATATAGNIWVADGTDFESVAMSGDASIAASGALTVTPNAINQDELAAIITLADADYIDLSAIVHDDAALQGLRLPQIGGTPTNPGSGEGFLGWDETNNTLEYYDGTAWTPIVAAATPGWDDVLTVDQGIASAHTVDLNNNALTFYATTQGGAAGNFTQFRAGAGLELAGNNANIVLDGAPSSFIEFEQNGTDRWSLFYISSQSALCGVNGGTGNYQLRLNNNGFTGIGEFGSLKAPSTTFHVHDGATAAGITTVMYLDKGTAVAGAAGDGVAMEFFVDDDANVERQTARVHAELTNPATGGVSGDFIISPALAGSFNETFRALSTGQIQLADYVAFGSFTGTEVGFLAHDATGNVISVSPNGANNDENATATISVTDNNTFYRITDANTILTVPAGNFEGQELTFKCMVAPVTSAIISASQIDGSAANVAFTAQYDVLTIRWDADATTWDIKATNF